MANTEYKSRSNYFHVVSESKFREWAEKRDLEIFTNTSDEHMFAISADNGWPEWESDEDENGEFSEIDFNSEVSQHLVENEIAILQQIWNQKLRFVGGVSCGIDSRGNVWHVDLDDIYKVVSEATGVKDINLAQY